MVTLKLTNVSYTITMQINSAFVKGRRSNPGYTERCGSYAAAVDSCSGGLWWSAGRRSAPEAGGSRKRIDLWRAPRPKRERVVTLVRVARPTTLAPPGAPFLRAWRDVA